MKITDFEVFTPERLEALKAAEYGRGFRDGVDSERDDPARFHPKEFDVVVRAWPGPSDFAEVGEETKRGYEVIHPWTKRTTCDQLDVGEMLRCLLSLTGLITVNPTQMLTPEEWAEQSARWSANGARAKAEDQARIAAPYIAAIASLLDTFDGPDSALTPDQRAICDSARGLIPPSDGGA